VVAHAELLQALAPSVRHADVHRRSRVTREQIAQALVGYYHSSSTANASATFYRARVGGVPLTLSVLVEQDWLGLAVQLGSDQERFRLDVTDPNSAVTQLEGETLNAALVVWPTSRSPAPCWSIAFCIGFLRSMSDAIAWKGSSA
jgi:hypothetical protein